jgi:hypothetical protein
VNAEDESPTALRSKGVEGSSRRFAQSPSSEGSEEDDTDDDDRSPLFLVYHSWEHYSSARNIDGPHSGKPNIRLKAQFDQHQSAVPVESEAATEDEQLLLRSLPDPSSHTLASIRELGASTRAHSVSGARQERLAHSFFLPSLAFTVAYFSSVFDFTPLLPEASIVHFNAEGFSRDASTSTATHVTCRIFR